MLVPQVERSSTRAPRRVRGALYRNDVFGANHPTHAAVNNSSALQQIKLKYGSALLPMPYAEGCPAHPAYPAGHATFAGACATILKAFFNTNAVITNPVVPDATGSTLVPYTGPALTAGNEIDKLASNIAVGRIPAGVHWRSDSEEAMRLGEACAISVLQDMRRTWNEKFDGFSFRKFDGTTVTI